MKEMAELRKREEEEMKRIEEYERKRLQFESHRDYARYGGKFYFL